MVKFNPVTIFAGMFMMIMFSFIPADEEITINKLLKEMIDRDKLTSFPKDNYKSLQFSSYNRESISPDLPGWYADSDGEGFIRTEDNNGKKEWVIMEDDGPGVITRIWAVCFYYGLQDTIGANILFYLDGAAEPAISTNFFKLVKGQDFIGAPFAAKTTRAGNLYFPIPYAKSCKITMDKKAFYNIINYPKYKPGTKVKTFTMQDYQASAALQASTAKILTTTPDARGSIQTLNKKLNKGEKLSLKLPAGSNAVKQFEILVKNAVNNPGTLRSLVLTATFDNEQTVWVPVGDFFNNVASVKPYNMWERSVKADGTMVCRWVMPYHENGALTLQNLGNEEVEVKLSAVTGKRNWNALSMHFYATWRMDEPQPTFPLYDWNFLEATGKGVIVGDEWTVLNPHEGWWGEGDEKIYIDEDFKRNFPSHFGTGTEDYYGWAGGLVPTPEDEFSNPFLGNIKVGETRSKGYNICTRTRVLDAIPFQNKIRFDFEVSSGTDRRKQYEYLQYAQTTFWYGLPGVKHNRSPLPAMAAAPLYKIEDLENLIKEAKGKKYIVHGALEAESLKIINKKGAVDNFSAISVLGELSNGAMVNTWFEKPGDFIELKISEQFEKSNIQICAAMAQTGGTFNIMVNGVIKKTQDLYTQHAGVTNPYINLGECEPVNDAYTIRFEFVNSNKKARAVSNKYSLGIDFFMLKNKFLDR